MSELSLKFIQFVLGKHYLRRAILADVPAELQNEMQSLLPESEIRFAHTHDFNVLQAGAFQCVVLSGALQRDENFFKTMGQVRRVLEDDGLVIITSAGMNHPRNSRAKWRFTPQSLEILLEGFTGVYTEAYDDGKMICAYARKKPKEAVNPDKETAQNKELCHAKK